MGIIMSAFSYFIATRVIIRNDFLVFSIFYAAIPALVTGTPPSPAPISLFLTLNLSRLGKRNQLNLMLLYSLQNMSYFATVIVIGVACPLIVDSRINRPLQINYRAGNNSTFFIRVVSAYEEALYRSSQGSLFDMPTKLLFLPVSVLVFGFIGICSLYGIQCGELENPTNYIEWESLRVKKRMSQVQDLRLDDVINYLEGDRDHDPAPEPNLLAGAPQRKGSGEHKFKPILRTKSSDSIYKSVVVQEYTPEEDDTRKMIEAHFRGKPMDINFDRKKGEIVITYKNVNKTPTLFDIVSSKHMVYLYLRYALLTSFMFSSVAPIFFLNKVNRLLLTYLYTDTLVGPALISVGIIAGIALTVNNLILHSSRSKKLKITSFSGLNYLLILLINHLTESLLGMVLMAALSIFSYVYMQVLMSFLISIAVTDSKLINYLYPIMYTVQMFGTLIKIYIVDPNSESFQSLTFTMLIIQGLGFVFISGVNISKLRQLCMDYSAHVEKLEKQKNTSREHTKPH